MRSKPHIVTLHTRHAVAARLHGVFALGFGFVAGYLVARAVTPARLAIDGVDAAGVTAATMLLVAVVPAAIAAGHLLLCLQSIGALPVARVREVTEGIWLIKPRLGRAHLMEGSVSELAELAASSRIAPLWAFTSPLGFSWLFSASLDSVHSFLVPGPRLEARRDRMALDLA